MNFIPHETDWHDPDEVDRAIEVVVREVVGTNETGDFDIAGAVVEAIKANRWLHREVGVKLADLARARVTLAVNGQEALDRVGSSTYDLILMDCQMPEMDGFEASRLIRALPGEKSSVRIVAMTANAMTGDREECLRAGMDDYLSKPVRLQDLRAVLERAAAAAPTASGESVPI